MTERRDTHDELEQAVTAHLQREAARSPATRDLWDRVRARLGTPVREPWLLGWRRRWLRPVPAFAMAGVLVVAVGAAALLVAVPVARGTLGSFAAGLDPTPTPAPRGFAGPAAAAGGESRDEFTMAASKADTPTRYRRRPRRPRRRPSARSTGSYH